MGSTNKSRSRNYNKNNNRRGGAGGNIVNRVFDSVGPDGRVRGTPQQIIDKYQGLAHDAQLSGDRVAAESFLQYAEHYSRMLGEAQREMNERREAQDAQRKQNVNAQNNRNNNNQNSQNQHPDKSSGPVAHDGSDEQPDVFSQPTGELFPAESGANNLVETPESSAGRKAEGAPMVPVREMQAGVEVVEIKKSSRKPAKKKDTEAAPETAAE